MVIYALQALYESSGNSIGCHHYDGEGPKSGSTNPKCTSWTNIVFLIIIMIIKVTDVIQLNFLQLTIYKLLINSLIMPVKVVFFLFQSAETNYSSCWKWHATSSAFDQSQVVCQNLRAKILKKITIIYVKITSW